MRAVPLIVLLSTDPAYQARRRATVVALHVLFGIIEPDASARRGAREERVLDFPYGRLVPDGELEIFLRDRVPILVHHHDGKQHAEREDEHAVDVVLYCVADLDAECEQDDLGHGEECSPEKDVANRPPVIERPPYENDLEDDVQDNADDWPNEVNDEQSDGVLEAESSVALEC